VKGIEDAADRHAIVTTLVRYRRPNRVDVGDRVPALDLHRLDDGARQRFTSYSTGVRSCSSLALHLTALPPPVGRRREDVPHLSRPCVVRIRVHRGGALRRRVAAGVDEDEGVLPPQHTSLAERFAAARKGAERPRLTLLVLVDGMTP
jgi:hypothetical protein